MSTNDEPVEEGTAAPRARRVRITPLVAGIVFLVMAAAFALGDLDSIEDQVRVVWPGAMLAIGLGMLLGARQRPR